MSIDAVLFDLDGTLLDTALDFETAINNVLTEENRAPLPVGDIRSYVTNGSVGIVRSVFGVEPDDEIFPRLQTSLLKHYKNHLTDRTQVFPGLETTLALLKDIDTPWGIVTNKPSEYADPIVLSILPDSAVLVCPDHVQQPKPDPEGLFLACEKIAANPKNCIYVGDHRRDIEAGHAAGMQTIAVGWGYVDEQDHHSGWNADIVADAPADLAPILESIIEN